MSWHIENCGSSLDWERVRKSRIRGAERSVLRGGATTRPVLLGDLIWSVLVLDWESGAKILGRGLGGVGARAVIRDGVWRVQAMATSVDQGFLSRLLGHFSLPVS